MTPREALQMMDVLASRTPMTRPEHAKATEAIQVLAQVVNELDELKKDGEDGDAG